MQRLSGRNLSKRHRGVELRQLCCRVIFNRHGRLKLCDMRQLHGWYLRKFVWCDFLPVMSRGYVFRRRGCDLHKLWCGHLCYGDRSVELH